MTRDRLTAICTTVARPHCATEFLLSLREAMPDMAVLLAEQAEMPALESACADFAVRHMRLPFDCGLSRARNEMVRAITTDYFLLTEDDFRFAEAPDVDYCVRFLDAHPDFLCVTGTLEDLRAKPRRGRLAHNFACDNIGRGLIVLPIDSAPTREIAFEGTPIRQCHMGPNWGVFRRSMFTSVKLAWDEDYIIGGEHIDFYLRLAKFHPEISVGFSERLVCQHIDGNEDGYNELRNRSHWLTIFRSKWPFRYRYDLGGTLRLFETYDRAEPVPNPQADRLRELLRVERSEVARLQRQIDAPGKS